ncbi:hypothetical protein ATL39_1170 [Sinobaca qinghaiensis]|uniref:Short-subunit dehydrogenase n=2 Tax=Sinobaca qinghaiensis TaxID=342944 RepID=A0A419V6J7_9BACL|nr:hypothetical protein ATL39_1170 [Sinobaca qinghaiensis]
MLQRLSASERHFLYDILHLLLFSFDAVSLFLIRDDTIVVHIMFHRGGVVKQIKTAEIMLPGKKDESMKIEKTVVITGAGSGLGRYISIESAKRGYYPILVGRSGEKLRSVQRELVDLGVPSDIEEADIRNHTDNKRASEAVLNRTKKIDVLINNAGAGFFAEADSLSYEKARQMLEVNLLGLIDWTSFFLPALKEQQNGRIINIGSMAGRIATPKASAYAASKAGVIAYSNALRMELKPHRVSIMTVNTGPVKTPFSNKADPTGEYEKSVKRLAIRPDKLARTIVKNMETRTREINLPGYMNKAAVMYSLFPKTVEQLGKRQFMKK